MSFIKAAIADAKESTVVAEGEYSLTVKTASQKKSKAGNEMIACMIVFDDEPNAAPIFEHLVLPSGGEWDHLHLLHIRRFLTVFGIPFEENGFDDEDIEGATGKCLVGQEEGEQGLRNVLKLP